jgi:hypothetical protein
MMNIDRRRSTRADDRKPLILVAEPREANMDRHRFRNLIADDEMTSPTNLGPAPGFVACPACLWAAVPIDARIWQHQLYQLAYMRAIEERLTEMSRAAVGFSWN